MTTAARPRPTGVPAQVRHLACLVCGAAYRPDEVAYVCPDHGDDGILDVVYDLAAVGSRISPKTLGADPDPSMWRYRALLPVAPDAAVPPLRVGGTPLYDAPRLATRAGVARLQIKDETVEPTGSLKDRASAMALVKAAEHAAAVVTTASTGNAAAALAGIAASVGQPTVIFVPASAPDAKVAQLLAYGASVLLVEGSYDDAVTLCLRAAEAFGWYQRTTGYNPYMTEGKKTVAYEIAEQSGWDVPDVVVTGVGDGCIIGALHKGFADLHRLGWTDRVPRLIGVQAAGSAYLAEAWTNGEDVLTKPAAAAVTVADSIAAALPRDRLKAMRAVRETGGAFVAVPDDDILAAIPVLGSGCGVFAEPAGAAPWAGLLAALRDGHVSTHDRVVLLATGSGLKDVPAAHRAVGEAGRRPHRIDADLAAVADVVAALDLDPPRPAPDPPEPAP